MAQYVWVCVGEAFGWERTPNNMQDWHDHWLPTHDKDFSVVQFCFGVVAWNLWKCRNKMAIEKSFNKSPDSILDKIFYDIQRWKVLLKQQEQNELELKMQELNKKSGEEAKTVDFL